MSTMSDYASYTLSPRALRDGAADAVAALVAAAGVAPFVVAVDKAVAEGASGRQAIWPSFFGSCRSMVTSPVTFLRQPPFRYLTALFGGTYLAANLFSSYEDKCQRAQPVAKSATIFAANTSLSLWKDSAFAKLFGTKAPAPVPWSSLSSWWMRDIIGMSVIFVAPPIMAKKLHEEYNVDRARAEVITQVSLPLMIQPVVAPFHLLGYLLYNEPDAAKRALRMRSELMSTIAMRWIRVFPPFSIGTVVNRNLRNNLKAQ